MYHPKLTLSETAELYDDYFPDNAYDEPYADIDDNLEDEIAEEPEHRRWLTRNYNRKKSNEKVRGNRLSK